MQLTVDFWQLLGLLGGFLAFCVTACGVVGRVLLAQTQEHLDERFTSMGSRLESIETSGREESLQWRQLERDFMHLKTELPLQYVRREDYIRGQSIIEAKLDGLAVKIENAQLRGLIGVNKNVD